MTEGYIKRDIQSKFSLLYNHYSIEMARGKPVTEDVRKLIITSNKNGKSAYQIAKDLSLPRSTIQTIIEHHRKHGTVSCLKKTGRSRITSKAENRILRRIIKKNRRARAGELTVLWRDAIKKNISVDTCKRVMKRMGYGFYTAKEKPLLTQKQKTNRFKFAQKHIKWTADKWRRVIWSDESKFEVTVGDQRSKVIREKGEAFQKDCLKQKVKFPASLMIWGCMSAQGVGCLQFIDGTVNAEKYKSILEESLRPSIPKLKYKNAFTFQQDGAACHTAKTTMAWLKSKKIPTMTWPSSSPDLSPIESLWWKMKKKLRKDPSRSKADLREKLTSVWNGITLEECRALVDSMPLRIKAVLDAKGGTTKW